MQRQIDIQAAGMQQWVDVETKGTDSRKELLSDQLGVYLKFAAVNNTAYTLTIEKVVTKVSIQANQWETFTTDTNTILPPSRDQQKSSYPFYVHIKPKGLEVKWFEKGTVLTINGEVTFVDCLQKTKLQWFGGLYKYGPETFEYLEPLGTVPDHHTEHQS